MNWCNTQYRTTWCHRNWWNLESRIWMEVPRRKVNLSPTWQLQSLWQFYFRIRNWGLGVGDEPVQKTRCLMELDRLCTYGRGAKDRLPPEWVPASHVFLGCLKFEDAATMWLLWLAVCYLNPRTYSLPNDYAIFVEACGVLVNICKPALCILYYFVTSCFLPDLAEQPCSSNWMLWIL